jgi:Holliday junction DNA helicase RuvA
MIARLSGVLEDKDPDHLIVDVGGVGYLVFVSLQTFYRLPELGQRVSLHIHTHVREDVLQLFGFLDEQEKAGFVLLKGVSGIGPRLAVNILSGIPVEDLEDALRAGDVTRLLAIPGVGRRTAERLVVELREKVGTFPGSDGLAVPGAESVVSADAVSALINLGYRQSQAEKAVQGALRDGRATLTDIIQESLRSLSA